MAELVEENDDRQDEQEGNDVTDESMAQRIETMQKKLSHSIPLDASRWLRPQPSRMPLRQFEAIGRQLYFAHYGQRKSHRPLRSGLPGSRRESSRSWWPRPGERSPRI